MEDGGIKVLKERLEKFFHRVSSTVVIQAQCDTEQEIKCASPVFILLGVKYNAQHMECNGKTKGVKC